MSKPIHLIAAAALLLGLLPAHAQELEAPALELDHAIEDAFDQKLKQVADDDTSDASVAAKLDAKGTPYEIDEDGDYRILVNLDDGRSQLVWVRNVVHTTDEQRIREIWSYGLRSDERRLPAHIANRLLSANMDLILGGWARQDGNALLIIKIDADADADTLDEAIDLAASIADRMEQQLVTGDEL